MADLFENELFLQYLAGAGGEMSAGRPIGPALSQITQSVIGAKSQASLQQQYLEMLRKMLSGEVPEGGKLVTDSKGMKVDLPRSALDTGLSLAQEGAQLPGGSGTDWDEQNVPRLFNPFR